MELKEFAEEVLGNGTDPVDLDFVRPLSSVYQITEGSKVYFVHLDQGLVEAFSIEKLGAVSLKALEMEVAEWNSGRTGWGCVCSL